jgi:pimeloyl-ACP methyl ester carboxylesterase
VTKNSDLHPEAHRIAGAHGVTINAWDYGGTGPNLLLCHCTRTHGRIWDPVIARLGNAYRVLSIDSRGHGDSEAPMQRDAYLGVNGGRDVLEVIRAFNLDAAFAAGHSGGAVHLVHAALLSPTLFNKLILIDAIIGKPEMFKHRRALSESARRRRQHFPNRAAARERFAGKPPMSEWTTEALDAYLDFGFHKSPEGALTLKCRGEAEAWVYETGGGFDLFDRLGDLQPPTLLVTGSESNIAAVAEEQFRHLPNARKIVLEGAGHFIPQERPEETAALLREWFQ